MKKFMFGVIAVIALLVPFAGQHADAQVRIAVGNNHRRPVHHYHRPVRHYNHR